MNEYAAVNAKRGHPRKQHVIGDDISYTRDYISCACGWSGKARDETAWAAHRLSVGAPRTNSGILGPARGKSALRVMP